MKSTFLAKIKLLKQKGQKNEALKKLEYWLDDNLDLLFRNSSKSIASAGRKNGGSTD